MHIMKFNEYLKLINKTPYRWAKENKLDPVTIWRAFNNKHSPALKTIMKIEEASNGAVRPEDWY